MKPKRTWILVADGSRARILERVGHKDGVRTVSGSSVSAKLPKSADLVHDRLGRVHESVGPTRHAIEPKHDPHQQLELLFANQLAEILETAATRRSFESLVIVAPPAMLGNLRKSLSGPVRKSVTGEMALDLTKVPDDEVLKHLESELML